MNQYERDYLVKEALKAQLLAGASKLGGAMLTAGKKAGQYLGQKATQAGSSVASGVRNKATQAKDYVSGKTREVARQTHNDRVRQKLNTAYDKVQDANMTALSPKDALSHLTKEMNTSRGAMARRAKLLSGKDSAAQKVMQSSNPWKSGIKTSQGVVPLSPKYQAAAARKTPGGIVRKALGDKAKTIPQAVPYTGRPVLNAPRAIPQAVPYTGMPRIGNIPQAIPVR